MKSENKLDFIIDKRVTISIILTIILSIVGFLINMNNTTIVEWILNTSTILSPWCNLKFFGLLLSMYELFMIITDKTKSLSVAGAIVITFSSAIVYNFTKIDSIIFGALIIFLLNNILTNEKRKTDILYMVLIVLLSIFYSYSFIPYAICFGYVYLGLTIYLLIINKEKLNKKKALLILTLLLTIICVIGTKYIIPNTYVETKKLDIRGLNLLFSYLYSIFLPFNELNTKALLAGIIGLSPLPVFISLYYVYKNEKHEEFLLPVTIISVLEIVFCLVTIPEPVKNILLLGNVEVFRMIPAVQFSGLLIIFYFLSNIKEKLFSTKVAIRVTIGCMLLLAFIRFPEIYSSRLYLTGFIFEQTTLSFMFLNLEEKTYRKAFVVLLLIFTLIGGVPAYFLG